MKYIYALIIAISVTGNAYACLEFVAKDGLTEQELDNKMVALDFGGTNIADEAKEGSFLIVNTCDEEVNNITLSISGNPKVGEFCFSEIFDGEPCINSVYPLPGDNPSTITLDGNEKESDPIPLFYNARHSGKKKKRLNADGIISNGDVSVSTRILGEASKTYPY